ncbi:sulfite exporter TauE/SafE family protein [Sulfurimonas sp.]|uniref:sulfite exporter TauE/SafE family protein n=1 Tax=Sulfurimonas sp. TaxID=2022749 RepID=UPI003D102880
MKKFLQGLCGGAIIATLAGLIGLGGAEFRLPLLKSVFQLKTLKAVILNKATSLVVVFFALLFRSYEIPLEQLWEYKTIIFNLLFGSMIGAWLSAGFAMKIDEVLLDKFIFVLLLFLAGVLLLEHLYLDHNTTPLFETFYLQITAGVLAGFFIGAVASILGVAGGELLIPAIILLYGVDIKLAGSLSLAISLPTMIIGFTRYTRSEAFIVLKEERNLFIALAIGSLIGSALGSAMLWIVSSDVLILLLSLILVISAYKSFHHQKKH